MSRRCLECKRLMGGTTRSIARRGLCRTCYRNPDIRDDYQRLPGGAWKFVGRVWDTTDDSLLTDLFEEGFSDKQIARQLARTEHSIEWRRRKLGMVVSPARQATHRRKKPEVVCVVDGEDIPETDRPKRRGKREWH